MGQKTVYNYSITSELDYLYMDWPRRIAHLDMLMTGELSKLLQDVVDALGGEAKA